MRIDGSTFMLVLMSKRASKGLKNSAETLQKEDVVQAVVIVDSFKGGFHPITYFIPAALVPVVNTPLLDYTLEWLALSSVQEVILFCSSHADLIKEHIRKSKWNELASAMVITVMVSETCRSLGDAMRDLDAKAVIRSDFILVFGDMVGNVNLLPILEHHRKLQKQDKGVVMTMVYKEAGHGYCSRSVDDKAVLTVDSSTGRVLLHNKMKVGTKRINIPLETYSDCPQVELRYDLQDTHVAVCSPAVPPLFSDNFDFQTRDDFVRGLLMNEEILGSTIYWYKLDEAQYAAHVSNWQMYQSVSHDIIYRWVYPFVPDSPFIQDVEPYVFLRHNVYKQKSVRLGKGCLLEEDIVIGENTSVGENTHISHSVVGKYCHIGKNVTIYKSYIWDNVVIGDNCHISCAVVGHDSKLGTGVRLCKGSVLSPGVVLPSDIHLDANIVVCGPLHRKQSLDHDVYKQEKLAEKAYRLLLDETEYDSEDSGQAQKLCGLWLGTSGGDSESESEEELSASNETSDRASPVPDDTYLFFSEVMDSLTRGYDDKLHPDNLILEINSSRYAYNVSVREVNYFVVKALLSLPIQARSADSAPKYLKEFNKMLQDFLPILQNYVRNSDAQHDCLQALEDMASSTDTLHDGLSKLLHLLYEKDILAEDIIMKWYNSGDENSTSTALRKQWLKEADEESDESDSD
ncbi:translation initiation factor eIF-2B subunit epsilon isoform X3 [Zootermopsis nevadensis]|uniref:translation initiation factor eIF-2B subunit epsilon isoform X3 n=1 Tax=Zootermopsis nevadensis TaxID=136037 RepID=UPI000B8E530D|nr:translation initiation factor eIF-2B subunit epsilon isoform X3 [Zootermopsis nevadensis]